MNNKAYMLNFSPACADAPQLWAPCVYPTPYHRTDEFRDEHLCLQESLKGLAESDGDVVLATCTGTGALECVIGSLESSRRALVVSNGYFGDRLFDMAQFHGLNPSCFRLPDEVPLSKEHESSLAEALIKTRAEVLIGVHLETSTGIVNDLQVLSSAACRNKAVTVIDGVSALGAIPCRLTEWAIDCYVSVSYKSLMAPAALSMIFGSKRFFELASRRWSFFLDMQQMREKSMSGDCLWSPAAIPMRVLGHVLNAVEAEGAVSYFRRAIERAQCFRDRLRQQGLTVVGEDAFLSACFSVIKLSSASASQIVEALRSEYGIAVALGLGGNKLRRIRLGHYPVRTDAELAKTADALGRTCDLFKST